jgi:hypothetical protein
MVRFRSRSCTLVFACLTNLFPSTDGIAGQIFGSVNFKEGERVETSPIVKGEIENGKVVTTESGSRYFLSDKTVKDAREEIAKAAPIPKELLNAKPRATIRLTQEAKEREAKTALEAVKKATPGATFSLATLFGRDSNDEKGTPSIPSAKARTSPVVKKGPKGVPAIGRWKQNRDKSISGLITGSMAFPDGEKITTSPIAKGTVAPGEVVVTSSGTRYFLL